MQVGIPAVLMRGGTSKGLYFERADLPGDRGARDRVLLAAMGSPDPRQIDGAGGANPLTSKVAIVGPSATNEVDVDYLFAQVHIEQAIVDLSPTCGNILAGVGPFAIERGMVEAADGETRLRIRMVNTGGLVEAIVQTPGRRVRYDGDVAIDGVRGTSAPVLLELLRCVGSKTGAMLPSGKPQDEIDGVPVTLIDVAMPMMVVRADSLGKTGYETPAELDADTALFARVERMRRTAGELMGMGDVSGVVIPKVSFVAPPQSGLGVSSRYLVPNRTHQAHAATGAICVASAAVAPGTVASEVARIDMASKPVVVAVEHPAGRLEVRLDIHRAAGGIEVVSAGLVRTARLIFDGRIYVPGNALEPRQTGQRCPVPTSDAEQRRPGRVERTCQVRNRVRQSRTLGSVGGGAR